MFLFGWCTRARLLLTILFTVPLGLIGTGIALAHEGRDVGDYNFVVGFISEPAVEGMLNGVSIRITSAKADDHEHEDDAATGDGTGTEIDLVSHGGVFVGELAAGAHYEFTFSSEFDDLTVPFHAHPVEAQGSIMIGHDKPAVDVIVIEIHENGFEPAMAMIRPDTTIRFENHMAEPTVVMSGPLSEVTAPEGAPAAANAVTGLTTLQVEVTHMASLVSQVMSLTEAFGNPGQYRAEFIPTSPGGYRFRFFGDIEGTAIDETFESSNTTFDEVTPASEIQFPIRLTAQRETENAARGALTAANEAGSDASDASSSASTAKLLGMIALVFALVGLALGGAAFRRSGSRSSSL